MSLEEFIEPNTRLLVHLTLIKENLTLPEEVDLTSKQAFSVIITVGDANIVSVNSAALGSDFSLSEDPFKNSTLRITFPPDAQSVEFTIFLESDDLLEGTEAFQVDIASEQGFPPFMLPPPSANLSAAAVIIIRDNDCKNSI